MKKTRDPFTHPYCRAEDLGLAIPDSWSEGGTVAPFPKTGRE